MKLFPAIDILDGKCVRLLYGEKDKVTVYGDAVEMAKKWEGLGAEALHVVDLDGAFSGSGRNLSVVARIVKAVSVPVQLGGGIRSMEDITQRIEECGVFRVILGTSAVRRPELVEEAVKRYGEAVACGVDVKGGKVAIRGWTEQSALEPVPFCKALKKSGVTTVIYTDVARDGALTGVNAKATIALQRETGLNVIASGGVASLADVETLVSLGVYGAILGKALYTGALDLTEALCSARG